MAPQTKGATVYPMAERIKNAYNAFRNVPIADPGTPNPTDTQVNRPFLMVPQTGQNKRRTPAASKSHNSAISHEMCRNLSNACEPMRLMIETRKDQLCKHSWTWTLKKKAGEGVKEYKIRAENSYNVKFLNSFFRKPDREHIFQQWLRMVLEEIIVIDEVYIYKQTNMLGDLERENLGRVSRDGIYSLPLLSGLTFNKMIADDGSRPEWPNIAYQQIVNGRIVGSYDVNELYNYMRNPRVDYQYGCSPVEQTIYLINMALRRATMQLSHYTEGNFSAAMIGTPPDWSPEEIAAFQSYWDLLMTGNSKNQAKGLFVPGGMQPIFWQSETLKDDFDEYIIRLFAYALSVSPTSLVKSLNRASAEQQRDQADEEGVQVWTANICAFLNDLVEEWFGITDCEIRPSEDRSTDPLKQAQTDKIYIESGVESVDEIRERNGRVPIGVGNFIKMGAGIISLTGETDSFKFITPPKDTKTTNPPTNEEGVL